MIAASLCHTAIGLEIWEICEVKPQNKNDHTLYINDYKIIIQVTVSRTSQEEFDMVWEFLEGKIVQPKLIQINF